MFQFDPAALHGLAHFLNGALAGYCQVATRQLAVIRTTELLASIFETALEAIALRIVDRMDSERPHMVIGVDFGMTCKWALFGLVNPSRSIPSQSRAPVTAILTSSRYWRLIRKSLNWV